jgi:hypothetical protein
MKSRSKVNLIFLFLAAMGFTSCIKKEEFPVEPVIRWESYSVMTDSKGYDSLSYVKISYTDGDGDIGLYNSDTLPPYKYNFFVTMFQMNKGHLQEIIFPDTNLNFNGRIPILTPSGRNKNIKGEIELMIELYFARPVLANDTIAFDIYLMDRALHKSNVVSSPLFLVRKP